MILAIEPVFPNGHHAATNGGILRALRLATGSETIVFAAHPAHSDAVFEVLGQEARADFTVRDIEVLPAGGVTFRRFCSVTRSLFRLVRRLKPRLLLCLGTHPETLFACRLLTTVYRGLTVIAMLHGNLHTATGWRSRDPRRRWFDDRASIDAAIRAPAIQFVVLDDVIRDAATAQGLLPAERCHVWPPPSPEGEIRERPHMVDPNHIRIGFLGSAKWAKGFGDFAAVTRRLAERDHRYSFSLIGSLQDPFAMEDLTHIDMPNAFLDRNSFLNRLYDVDYVCLPLHDDTYTLTFSGALLDAITARKPIIALPTPSVRNLFAGGSAGFLCENLADMEAVMGDPARLAEPVAYKEFCSRLERELQARSPARLAQVMRPLIMAGV